MASVTKARIGPVEKLLQAVQWTDQQMRYLNVLIKDFRFSRDDALGVFNKIFSTETRRASRAHNNSFTGPNYDEHKRIHDDVVRTAGRGSVAWLTQDNSQDDQERQAIKKIIRETALELHMTNFDLPDHIEEDDTNLARDAERAAKKRKFKRDTEDENDSSDSPAIPRTIVRPSANPGNNSQLTGRNMIEALTHVRQNHILPIVETNQGAATGARSDVIADDGSNEQQDQQSQELSSPGAMDSIIERPPANVFNSMPPPVARMTGDLNPPAMVNTENAEGEGMTSEPTRNGNQAASTVARTIVIDVADIAADEEADFNIVVRRNTTAGPQQQGGSQQQAGPQQSAGPQQPAGPQQQAWYARETEAVEFLLRMVIRRASDQPPE